MNSKMKMHLLALLSLVVSLVSGLLLTGTVAAWDDPDLLLAPSPALAALPPEPTYGMAVVDGEYGDWELQGDFFADLYRAGDTGKKLEAKLYLRYDCSIDTLYMLVLGEEGVPVLVEPDNAFVRVDGLKVVDGDAANDGTPPDFAWVGLGEPTVPIGTAALGWEASAYVAPGSHVLSIVHTNVWDDGESQTAKVMEIDLQIACPTVIDIDLEKTASPTSVPETGGDVTFSVEVVNNSTSDATLDSLVDDIHGDLNGQGDCSVPQTLAAGGGRYSCSFTARVSGDYPGGETDTIMAHVYNAAGADTAEGTATVTFTDALPDISVSKTAGSSTVPESGGNVTFTYQVTNNSEEAAILTVLSDDQFGALAGDADCQVGTVLAGGASCSFDATFTLPAGDYPGSHVNQFSATVTDDDGNGNQDTATDTASVDYTDVLPDISVSKTADPTLVPETGGDVTFTFVVYNNSTEAATVAALSDDVFGTLAGDADCQVGTVLAGGASCSFQATFSLPAGDYPGTHTNLFSATGEDDDGNSDSGNDSEDVTYTDVLPDISVSKTANQAQVFAPGEDVEFTIVVTNNSLEDATIDSLGDSDFDLATRCRDAVGTVLGYGESYTCVFTEFVGADHENTVTVAASDNDDNSDTESATETVDVINPSIDIEKSTNGLDADTAPGPEILSGASVTWEYVVTNDGDVDLTDITVTDSVLGSVCTISSLAAGSSTTCTVTGTAQAGQYANTGIASTSYTDEDGDVANHTDSDDSHYFGVHLEITIDKQVSDSADGPWSDSLEAFVGTGIYYRFVVANSGNVTLDVTVTDPALAELLGWPADHNFCDGVSLSPGSSYACGPFGPVAADYTGQDDTFQNTALAKGVHSDFGDDDEDTAEYSGQYWGFTPGFWKNNSKGKHNAWVYTTYGPEDGLCGAFVAVESYFGCSEMTLLKALELKGGRSEPGAAEILLRAGTAALLNASFHETLDNADHPAATIMPGGACELQGSDGICYYPYASQTIMAMVNDALASGDRDTMLELAAELDGYNNGIHEIDWSWPTP